MRGQPILLAVIISISASPLAFGQGAWHQFARAAKQELEHGQLQQAESDCLKALNELPSEDPRLPLSLLDLGRIYTAEGKDLDAERALRKGASVCRSTRPVNVDLYCDFLRAQAVVYRKLGKPELAVRAEEHLGYIIPKEKSAAPAETRPPKQPQSASTTRRMISSTSKADLDDMQRHADEILKYQREHEQQTIDSMFRQEQEFAAAQEREREQQLKATRQFEEKALALQAEREKAAMAASRRSYTFVQRKF